MLRPQSPRRPATSVAGVMTGVAARAVCGVCGARVGDIDALWLSGLRNRAGDPDGDAAGDGDSENDSDRVPSSSS